MDYKANQMTQAQKDTVLYYIGTGEYDKASQYLADIERELNERANSGFQETMTQWAQEHPVQGALTNMFSWPLSIPATVENLGEAVRQKVTGEYAPADVNRDAYLGARIGTGTSQGVQEAARQAATDAFGNETAGDVAAFLAGTGLSIGQNITQLPLGALTLPAMAASASGTSTVEALDRGATPGQAAVLGLSEGLIEALTEKLPLENLYRLAGRTGKQGVAQAVRGILGQMGTEAAEETVSEIAGNLVDTAVMRDKSEYQSYIRQLMDGGMSQEQAEWKAFLQFYVKNTLQAAVGGALSGGVLGGGATAINAIANRNSAPAETTPSIRREDRGMLIPRLRTATESTTDTSPVSHDTQRVTTPQIGSEGQNNTASTGETEAYTVERDDNGRVYVQINADILSGVPESKWKSTVRNVIQKIFGDGISLPRGTVFSNRTGRGEYTNGSYSRMLERTDPSMYSDKLRMSVGTDAMLQNTEMQYEDSKHQRNDDIVGFNRGNIVVSVKGNGYLGDILTAVYSDGKETFFDINNLRRENIKATSPERYTEQVGFTQTGDAAFNNSIPQTAQNVNPGRVILPTADNPNLPVGETRSYDAAAQGAGQNNTASTGETVGAQITSDANIWRYRNLIDGVFTGVLPTGSDIVLGQTPPVLTENGFPELDIHMTQSVARKIAYPSGYMGGKHNLGLSALKNLPYQLADPIAIIDNPQSNSRGLDSKIILTEWNDMDGKPVIVPIHLNAQGAVDVQNDIASAFGADYIKRIIGENGENVLYTKNNEDIQQLLSKGRPVPQAMADDVLARNSIPPIVRDVNGRLQFGIILPKAESADVAVGETRSYDAAEDTGPLPIRLPEEPLDSGKDMTYNNSGRAALAEDEYAALLDYKSSGSYKLNAAIRDGRLDPAQEQAVAAMDRALATMPVYRGRVYRRMSFDLSGPETLAAFLAEHEAGSIIVYPAYTSTSTSPDGYPVNGNLTVTLVIDGHSGRNIDGFGNNFESEILFPRESSFYIERLETDDQGKPVIYMREVAENGEGIQPGGTGGAAGRDYRGQQGESPQERSQTVQ